ncbi:MAG: DNA-3-methyladenine glycosylase [Gemmatimonadales bacterium]|nr:DNA-3-methyladenine glycosylase [Gemmatimonadales bacterium]
MSLTAAFFRRGAEAVARDLLGCVVVMADGTSGRVVETEAYLGIGDPASHAWGGRRSAANASIYAPPGHWYVYRSYGIHWCANLTCGPAGEGHAVLLRALAPVSGLEAMRARRPGVPDHRLAAGPGCLTRALGLSRAHDAMPRGPAADVRLDDDGPVTAIVTGPRIGISRAADWPLRFGVRGAQALSRPFPRAAG